MKDPPPPSGWIKAIRVALGMTIRELAARVGVGPNAIAALENREQDRKVTLESLDRAAAAMDCKVIYAIVPKDENSTLEDIIETRALESANQLVKNVSHSMTLEKQGTSKRELDIEIARVTEYLKENTKSGLWKMVPTQKKKKR